MNQPNLNPYMTSFTATIFIHILPFDGKHKEEKETLGKINFAFGSTREVLVYFGSAKFKAYSLDFMLFDVAMTLVKGCKKFKCDV